MSVIRQLGFCPRGVSLTSRASREIKRVSPLVRVWPNQRASASGVSS